MMARSAGFPVPKIISYGDHPDTPWAPMSIIIPRIPGKDMDDFTVWEGMNDDERTAIRSIRVPDNAVGPCESESEFNNHLFGSNSSRSFESQEQYEELVEIAERLRNVQHPIIFTHGDLQYHNVVVLNGHVTALLDWETAGWYPDYWDFTTPLKFGPKDHWWNWLIMRLGGERYTAELESEKALVPPWADAWSW
ncbi:hypothetical protein CFE70_007929 [Pyrenophora teres f. teres 0-1]